MIDQDQLIGNCSECGDPPISLSRISGVVYVISSKHQTGVKVGMTRQHVKDRLKQLNSGTASPGGFKIIAAFPSRRPVEDEKKVHKKLARHRLEREHFDLDPIDAALKAYRVLNRKRPIFYDEAVERRFDIELELARLEMEKKVGARSNRGRS